MTPAMVEVLRTIMPSVIKAAVVERWELRGNTLRLRMSAVVTQVHVPYDAANDTSYGEVPRSGH